MEPTSPNEARRNRLRDTLALGGFVTLAGLVPWRGALAADAGCRVRALAGELGTDPRIAAISITDSAGGHAMLSPEVLASQLATDGIDAIVHVVCRDRNRNEFLSLAWRLARTGIGNPQVLSGDYPTGLPRGRHDRLRPRLCEPARPVRGPQPGRGRPRRGGPPGPRDRTRVVAPLGPPPARGARRPSRQTSSLAPPSTRSSASSATLSRSTRSSLRRPARVPASRSPRSGTTRASPTSWAASWPTRGCPCASGPARTSASSHSVKPRACSKERPRSPNKRPAPNERVSQHISPTRSQHAGRARARRAVRNTR